MAADVITTRSLRVAAIIRERQQKRASAPARKAADVRWEALRQKREGGISADEPNRGFIDEAQVFDRIIKDGAWKGHRCFVVGGGPSLQGFDFSQLSGELTIGVNRAFEHLDCPISFSMDSRYFDWLRTGRLGPESKRKFEEFQGYKVWLDTVGHDYKGVYLVRSLGRHGVSDSISKGLFHGNNSGYAAINLALCLGASPIYLLGFDAGYTGGKTHFHEGYPITTAEDKLAAWVPDFTQLAEAAPSFGSSIVNLCRSSRIRCFEFGDFADIPRVRRPVIFNYHTPGAYAKEAEHLKASLRRWNLPSMVVETPDLGLWQKNTAAKPLRILEALDSTPRDVVYVDADAVFQSYPFAFENFEADLGICARDYALFPSSAKTSGLETLTGTIYFRNNEAVGDLIRKWIAENEAYPTKWEQRNLQNVLEGRGVAGPAQAMIVKRLPDTYCQIFDLMKGAGDPVIEHFQASRRLKDRPCA